MNTAELKNIIRNIIKSEMHSVIREEVHIGIQEAFGKLASGQPIAAAVRPTNVVQQNTTNDPPPVSRPQIAESSAPIIKTRFANLNEALRQTSGGIPLDPSAQPSNVLEMVRQQAAGGNSDDGVRIPSILTEVATGGKNFSELLRQADAIAKKRRA